MFIFEIIVLYCSYTIGPIKAGRCTDLQYQCFNGDCIDLESFCNERPDCKDKSDETDCFNECLLRGDIVGRKYNGQRRITAQGLHCNQPCRWDDGIAPQCVSQDGQIQYCQIPICGSLQERSLEYLLGQGQMKWKLIDLNTYQVIGPTGLEYENYTDTPVGRFSFTGLSDSKFVLRSPIVEVTTNVGCVRIEYSLMKSANVDVKLIEWGSFYEVPGTPKTLDNTNAECSQCARSIEIYANDDKENRYQVKLYIFLFHQGNFNLTLEIIRVTLEPVGGCGVYTDTDSIGEYIECSEELFKCMELDERCVPTDVINDKYEDCGDTFDEQLDIWSEREICGSDSMTCNGSNSCLPLPASQVLIGQCRSKQWHLPVETTSTSCPSFYTCKHRDIKQPSLLTCVSESELCDGIPQCPHWDDEVNCPLFCPPECTKCNLRRFHCPPSALSSISTRVSYLDLSGHLLDIKLVCSVQRLRLVFLNVSSCGLTDIACLSNTDIFPNIQVLDVSNNRISVVKRESYQYNPHFTDLILDQNPIRLIMVEINKVSLRNCSIHTIELSKSGSFLLAFNSVPSLFNQIPLTGIFDCILWRIDLSFNYITDFGPLKGCYVLQDLILHQNNIKDLTTSPFSDVNNVLTNLILSANMIENLEAGFFQKFKILKMLNLSMNNINDIKEGTFKSMINLRVLDISYNKLVQLPVGIFDDLFNIVEIYIQGNIIETLDTSLLKETIELEVLDLSKNRLSFIPRNFFSNLRKLRILDLKGNKIVVERTMFGGLGVLQHLKVYKYSLCCVRPSSVHLHNCEAEVDYISCCYHLLGSKFLSVSIWIISAFSLCGNMYLLWLKNIKFQRPNDCLHFLFTNSIFNDILIGIYLLVIGYFDVVKRGSYGLFHDVWKTSNICKIIGMLATSSLLGHSLILIFYSMLCLFSTNVHRKYLCQVLSVSVNIMTFFIASLPIVLSNGHFYAETNICLTLPFSRRSKVPLYLENTYFFYVFLCPVAVLIVILSEVIRLKRRQRRKGNIHVPSNGTESSTNVMCLFYVLNHCICCIPVFILGYMALLERHVTDETYKFVTIFIIATPSAVNPLVQIYLLLNEPDTPFIQKVRLKTVYPDVIYLRSIIEESSNMFLVLNPKISRKYTISVCFRGESGWMQKATKVQIINKVIKCGVPKYIRHHITGREKVSVQVFIEELHLRSNSLSIYVYT